MSAEIDMVTESAIDLVYELAVDSYDPVIKRLDTMDSRLQTIMGFAATTMALVPSVASARNLSFKSSWFWAGVFIFVLIIIVGTYARHYGKIILNDPGALLKDDWLLLQPNEFKKFFIKYAAVHWDKNTTLVRWKWQFSVWISIAYFVQVALFVCWIASQRLYHP